MQPRNCGHARACDRPVKRSITSGKTSTVTTQRELDWPRPTRPIKSPDALVRTASTRGAGAHLRALHRCDHRGRHVSEHNVREQYLGERDEFPGRSRTPGAPDEAT